MIACRILEICRPIHRQALREASALIGSEPLPAQVWSRIPAYMREPAFDLALKRPELSPRELPMKFTDDHRYFMSNAHVYQLIKGHDLITSPAFVVIKTENKFKDKTTAPTRYGKQILPT